VSEDLDDRAGGKVTAIFVCSGLRVLAVVRTLRLSPEQMSRTRDIAARSFSSLDAIILDAFHQKFTRL
jgi:hypothetical protein